MGGGEVVPKTCRALGGGARQEEDLGRGCQGRGLPQRSSSEERTGPRPGPRRLERETWVRSAPEDIGCGWRKDGGRGRTGLTLAPSAHKQGPTGP